LVLIFFQSYFVQIRFASGVFFTILACLYFVDGAKVKAILIFLVALAFHNIASLFIVIIPVYYFLRNHIDKYYIFLPLLLFIATVDVYLIIEFIIENIFPRYLVYLSLSDDLVGNPILFYWRFILYSFLMLLLFFRESDLVKSGTNYELFFKLLLYFNLASWAVGYNFSIFYRISWFFDSGLLYFVFSFNRSRFLYKKILCMLLLTMLFIVRFYASIEDFDSFYFDWYVT